MAELNGKIGTVGWVDLTVADAPKLRDFYSAVVGWTPSPVKMGDYEDFNMNVPGRALPAAGVCHARGHNAGLPAQWIMYVWVKDVVASVAACERLGGKVVHRVSATCAVLEDPAGAIMAVMQVEE
jgi:predicted enzyme related to lactoylglutathione lyase